MVIFKTVHLLFYLLQLFLKHIHTCVSAKLNIYFPNYINLLILVITFKSMQYLSFINYICVCHFKIRFCPLAFNGKIIYSHMNIQWLYMLKRTLQEKYIGIKPNTGPKGAVHDFCLESLCHAPPSLYVFFMQCNLKKQKQKNNLLNQMQLNWGQSRRIQKAKIEPKPKTVLENSPANLKKADRICQENILISSTPETFLCIKLAKRFVVKGLQRGLFVFCG